MKTTFTLTKVKKHHKNNLYQIFIFSYYILFAAHHSSVGHCKIGAEYVLLASIL